MEVFTDKSYVLKEFWRQDLLYEANSLKDLKYFLKNTQYELDKTGKCKSEYKIINL